MPLLIYQGRLSMLDRKPQETGILDFCAEKGVGFIAFSPLAQGLLTDRYLNGIPADSRMSKGKFLKESVLTPELLQKLRRYNDVASNRGETLAEMALAWVLKQRGVTSVLIGASSTAQLEKNLRCVSNHSMKNYNHNNMKRIISVLFAAVAVTMQAQVAEAPKMLMVL